ncbi:cyclic nucleotide-binding domain-containing protein 2-like [Plakobranchus ocellatus]|uniref:Cyclic nucleotide-binding domain-containing protein 2-like n=1 Tax=Plakobranchus ocellatus TaxID=259542 RepID=A0AAV4BM88_9GAST|nr:cyclic nucleotide-binding domain-containing protein 2-like [Plakobranchus ocellatus]
MSTTTSTPKPEALAKVFWSDDVFIDPNVIFGTANVQSVWSTPLTTDREASLSRRQSYGSLPEGALSRRRSSSRWTQSMLRLNSIAGPSPGPATRRGTLLLEKVVADARLARQNSSDDLGSISPSSPTTQPKFSAKKKFVSLARAGSTVRQLFRSNRSLQDVGLEDLNALDKFKVMVRKIQVNRRWSGDKETPPHSNSLGQIVTDLGLIGSPIEEDPVTGSKARRTVSFGDVTMGAIHKNVDRKKLLRLHKWGQEYNRKKHLIFKFQRAVQLTVFCRRLCNEHSVKSQEPNEFSPFIKIDCQEGYEPDDLLFDPSKFKANKESRITDEFIRIMSKLQWDRTPQEIYYAQIALRNIECFQDFPARMQKKIAERGLYENSWLELATKRLLRFQGVLADKTEPPVLYKSKGSERIVAVMVLEQGEAFAKPVAYLTKGQTFGDYHDIFMAGGVKTMTDPDHDEFLKSLSFLKGWPLNLLQEKTGKCLFLYFKRGDVLVKDSQYSDWLIIVKSGSLAVLKKLKKVLPYDAKPKDDPAANFVSEKAKRDRYNRRTLWKKLVLPEINVPVKNSDDESQVADYKAHFDEVGQPIPFQHPDPTEARMDSALGCRKIWNFGGRRSRHNTPGSAKVSHIQQHHVQLPKIVVAPPDKMKNGQAPHQASEQTSVSITLNQLSLERPENRIENEKADALRSDSFRSTIRTIHSDLDAGFARKVGDSISVITCLVQLDENYILNLYKYIEVFCKLFIPK